MERGIGESSRMTQQFKSKQQLHRWCNGQGNLFLKALSWDLLISAVVFKIPTNSLILQRGREGQQLRISGTQKHISHERERGKNLRLYMLSSRCLSFRTEKLARNKFWESLAYWFTDLKRASLAKCIRMSWGNTWRHGVPVILKLYS